jgi:hypothetical protein
MLELLKITFLVCKAMYGVFKSPEDDCCVIGVKPNVIFTSQGKLKKTSLRKIDQE